MPKTKVSQAQTMIQLIRPVVFSKNRIKINSEGAYFRDKELDGSCLCPVCRSVPVKEALTLLMGRFL